MYVFFWYWENELREVRMFGVVFDNEWRECKVGKSWHRIPTNLYGFIISVELSKKREFISRNLRWFCNL